MEKIKGLYNGYKLNSGKIYRLIERSINNYEMAEVTNLDLENLCNYKEIPTGKFFTRVKDYKEYLKTL